jgi:Protein of unknown function (DUF2950)
MTKGILTAYVALMFALATPAFAQEHFDSADAAAQALIDRAGKHDTVRLAAIFGPRGNAVLTSGKAARDRAEQAEFSQLAGTKHRLIADPRNSNRMILAIGDSDWPFPVPLVRSNGHWSFDASESQAEMQARRIGADELDAIEICAGYVEAQRRFASEEFARDAAFHYASHMTDAVDARDSLGPLVPKGLANATADGQKNALTPYHGYFFRILDNQGPHAPGGAHSYRLNDKLMGGFGLVAWPAQYGVTGVLTFIVNQDGEIYQKDIAPLPGGKVVPVTRYDPDPNWKPVN